MRKKLLSIIAVLLLLIAGVSAVLLRQGYRCYRQEVENLPIHQAVEAYTSKNDYVSFDGIDPGTLS